MKLALRQEPPIFMLSVELVGAHGKVGLRTLLVARSCPLALP